MNDLDQIQRAAEIAVAAGDDALLARAIAALGFEIAKRDPVARAMPDLDEQLRHLATAQLSTLQELRRVR